MVVVSAHGVRESGGGSHQGVNGSGPCNTNKPNQTMLRQESKSVDDSVHGDTQQDCL